MSNLIIRDINNIDLKNIKLLNEKTYIKIRYEYKNNIILSGLSFCIHNCVIKKLNNNYHLLIDNKEIKSLIQINDFLKKKINYYKSFLSNNYIIFYKNTYLNNLYNQNHGKIFDTILNIKYVKKGKDYYPIIHILNE